MSTIPTTLADLVDDAAIFPPGSSPLPEAVAAHREHRSSPHAALVGSFVISDVRLPELITLLRADPGDPMPVSVVVTGGAGALAPAVRWVDDAEQLDLRSVEFALRDEEDLTHNARRVTTALGQMTSSGLLDETVPVYVEPPRLHGQPPTTGWLGALDVVAAADLRLKFRTGGVSADAFPGAGEVATCIDAALDRELPFKCTAGLHTAVRHRDNETGFEHHGFLNVLLATRVSLDGAPIGYVATLLDETDAGTLVDRWDDVGRDGLVSARRWFTSFGSCSVLEPLADLIDLDLLPDPPLEFS